MKHWNEDSSIVMLSYTFYIGLLVQWNTGMKTAPLWCCLIHFIMDCLSNETLEWRHLHCDVVLYILYGILVQWNTGMKTAPLWCCLIHFIMDCLSNETLEWRQLHCDAVLYILYWILVQWNTGMKTAALWCCLIHFILDCLSNETLEWWQLHCDAVLDILYEILVQWNTGMKNGLLVQWNAGMKTAPLWCCLIHFIWDSCPMKHWNEDSSIVMLSYTFDMGFLSNETLEWRQLHCDAVLYILYGILVHIWDSCPMKHWNEDTSIVMLSYTFYMGFLSNEALEWRHLHCDVVLYILYWIACPMKHWNEDTSIVMLSYTFYNGLLVQWNTGMKTAPLWCCLIHFILDCLSNETLEWRRLHCDAVLYIL
jgi:hypothetical protein